MSTFRFQTELFCILLVLTDLCLLVYQGIQCFGRGRRFYLVPMILLLGLLGYELLADWGGNLFRTLLVNVGMLLLVALLMLLPNLKRRRPAEEAPPIIDNDFSPGSLFVANCKKLGFTPRELDIVLLVREGITNKEIADKLFITEKTVNSHLQHIFDKTGVRSKLALILKLNQ